MLELHNTRSEEPIVKLSRIFHISWHGGWGFEIFPDWNNTQNLANATNKFFPSQPLLKAYG